MGLVQKHKHLPGRHDHAASPPARKKRTGEEPWTRDDFYRDLERATSKIEGLIRKDPKEVARLKRRLRRAQEGEGLWGAEDKDPPAENTG